MLMTVLASLVLTVSYFFSIFKGKLSTTYCCNALLATLGRGLKYLADVEVSSAYQGKGKPNQILPAAFNSNFLTEMIIHLDEGSMGIRFIEKDGNLSVESVSNDSPLRGRVKEGDDLLYPSGYPILFSEAKKVLSERPCVFLARRPAIGSNQDGNANDNSIYRAITSPEADDTIIEETLGPVMGKLGVLFIPRISPPTIFEVRSDSVLRDLNVNGRQLAGGFISSANFNGEEEFEDVQALTSEDFIAKKNICKRPLTIKVVLPAQMEEA